jgi:hypothetical protein
MIADASIATGIASQKGSDSFMTSRVELANVQNGIQAARKNNIYADQTEYVKNIGFFGNEWDRE